MQLDIESGEFDYAHDLEGFCLVNCVIQILKYNKVMNPYKFLDASLELVKGYNDTDQVQFKTSEWIPNVADKIMVHNEEGTYEEVWEKNKESVRQGKPIIVSVDMYMLPYAFNYHMTHGNHAAILTGYSDDGLDARIVDWFEWKYKGVLSMEHYKQARTSICPKDNGLYSGTPINNKWTDIDLEGINYDEEKSLKDTINKTLENYYGYGKDNTQYMYGPAILQDIYNKIFDGDKNLQQKVPMINEFRQLCFRLSSYLKLFHYYINESKQVFDNPLLGRLEVEITKSIKLWDIILRTMLKCLYHMNEPSYVTISMNLVNAIKLEEQRFSLIKQIKESM